MTRSRNFTFLRSIGFGAFTKLAGSLVVFIGIPVIANSLTVGDYAQFLYAMSLGSFITLFLGGASTIATRRLALAHSSRSVHLVASAENETLGLYVLIAMASLLLGTGVSVLSAKHGGVEILLLASVLAVAAGAFGFGEVNRIASRTDHISSLWFLLGNIVLLGTVLAFKDRGIQAVVVVYFGVPALFQLINLCDVWRSNRRVPMPEFNLALLSHLPALGWLLVNSVSEYAKIFLTGLVVAQVSSELEYVKYTTLVLIVARIINPVSLITRPLLPTYIDAVHHDDAAWLAGVRKLLIGLLATGLIIVLTVGALCDPAYVGWMLPAEARPISQIEFFLVILFGAAHGFSALLAPFFLSQHKGTVFLASANALTMLFALLAGAAAARAHGALGMLAALAIGMLVLLLALARYLFVHLLAPQMVSPEGSKK